ncbi:hypothetical protein QYE76_036300 [Lolium multiflorum]|uniref:Protein FAR1-RELATED SEQUENCE n=1 Tax=Lolium multiflorum TaxID=4521 RepID=A0AAD8R2I8_LOLMU|nr:hypothetical protein QYE76_036300 [Lolium multiflorum]
MLSKYIIVQTDSGRPNQPHLVNKGLDMLLTGGSVTPAMDVSDLSASSMEYDSGNTDEEEFNISSANDNAPPEDEQTSGDDDVDESMDADGVDLEDDNVEQEEDVDTDNIQSDVVEEPSDDERLDSGFVDEVLVGDNSSYDYYGDSDLETIEEPVRRRHVKSVGKKKNGSEDEDESDTEDKRKFYWEVMEKTFVSEAAAYTFYNGYARQEGFSVRKFKFKQTKGANKIVRRRRFVCSREGKLNRKFLTMDNRTRRLRPLSRCNCKAEFDVKLDRGPGLWRVAKFVYKHSHKCAEPSESPFLWSHRRIKDFQKAEILALAAAGVRKHVIMDTFLSKYGRYTTVGFTRKDLYNMCCREKRKLLAGGDASSAIAMMENRRKKFADFFFEYDVDSKGHLKSLFWCDAQSRQDYNDYGDVLVFDSTYKMNRYGMPFVPFVGINNHRRTTVFACAILSDEKERTYVWVLKTFLKAMLQQKPKSIITDADSAMIRAIQSVFPEQSHRICSWHIEKNMARHLSFKSLSEFRALLYYTTTPDIFEERWHAFIQKWQTEKTQTWLKRMYKKRRLWAAAYLSEGFWLGMKSNQRNESLNSCLQLHLDYGMTLVDLILHYENAIVRIRETEAKYDCISSQTSPVPVTNLRRIERAAAKLLLEVRLRNESVEMMEKDP